jgi:hypothetical protein
MLDRLSAIRDITRARPLLQVLLKLFRLCVKVQRNQEVLTQPELGAIGIFLGILQLCLAGETDASQAAITEQLLDVSLSWCNLFCFTPVLLHHLNPIAITVMHLEGNKSICFTGSNTGPLHFSKLVFKNSIKLILDHQHL